MAGPTTPGSPSQRAGSGDYPESHAIHGFQVAPAIAFFGGGHVRVPATLTGFRASLGVAGAGNTTVRVRRNGAIISGDGVPLQVTLAAAATDGALGMQVDLDPNDRIEFETTAAGGGGAARLVVTADIYRRFAAGVGNS